MTSMYDALANGLHSLRNPRLISRFHTPNPKKEAEEAVTVELNEDLRNRLSCLIISTDQGRIPIIWLQEAVNVVCDVCAYISDLLPKVTCSEKDRIVLESNLEDALRLLDVCNALKESLNDLQHYVMLVRYAAVTGKDIKDTTDEELKARLSRALESLGKATYFMDAKVEENNRSSEGRSKLEACSSMLRNLGTYPHVAAPCSRRASSNAIFTDMYGLKVLVMFLFSVIAISLSIKPKRALSLFYTKNQPSWLEVLQTAQQNMKKLTDSAISCGSVAILKEVEEVFVSADGTRDVLGKFCVHEKPILDADKSNISKQCEQLSRDGDALRLDLLQLQQNLDRLFRMLLSIRVGLLDLVCTSEF
ncbi:hypothetical protein KP509_02G113500 [Ceratopteris richardii]|uniref:Uncharacterized protein n=1 Tax=Ceratopteris richardii TaxID=49495 RepID=A0A8T2VCZ9_CERRI|nr:hypothetical protein KP509_02G113500 [Ceratopteris richardii]KAH7445233.1 hypothetical protein KP509_02G113500 [Ceratopteris richardii]